MIGKYFGNNTEDAERLDGLNVTFLMLQVRKPCDSRCRTELEVFLIRRSHIEDSVWVQDIPYSRGYPLHSGVPRGGWGVQPPPEIPKALQKIVPNSTRL